MALADFIDGFFDGFGPGSLFVRSRRPGAPSSVFGSEAPELITYSLASPDEQIRTDAPQEGHSKHPTGYHTMVPPGPSAIPKAIIAGSGLPQRPATHSQKR